MDDSSNSTELTMSKRWNRVCARSLTLKSTVPISQPLVRGCCRELTLLEIKTDSIIRSICLSESMTISFWLGEKAWLLTRTKTSCSSETIRTQTQYRSAREKVFCSLHIYATGVNIAWYLLVCTWRSIYLLTYTEMHSTKILLHLNDFDWLTSLNRSKMKPKRDERAKRMFCFVFALPMPHCQN